LLSKQKVAASDELKCAETDLNMELENIMKTDLKYNICIAEVSLDHHNQAVKILDKQLANDYLLFTKTLHSRLRSCSTLLGADHYD